MVQIIKRTIVQLNKIFIRKLSVTKSLEQRCDPLKYSVNSYVDKQIVEKYRKLPQPCGKVIAKYVWIDGTGENVRAKSRTLDTMPKDIKDIPVWNFDGSSCYLAEGKNSDVYLSPVRCYKDPFRLGDNILVLCDTYTHDHKPTKTNFRAPCYEAMKAIEDCEPWWGIEQEFTLLDLDGRPFGWPVGTMPNPQGPYYCGVGADKVYARGILESLYHACLYAGIDFGGTNLEVMPSQMEFQIGTSLGMKAADDLWMARYILHRIAEEYGVVVTFDPKPMPGPWNGAGGHTSFSTIQMRSDGGMKYIEEAIHKLEKNHKNHIKVYDPKGGEDNERRLSGKLETSDINTFTWGVANRGVSVRIPRAVAEANKGYFEDRRPSANADPYQVCNAIVRTLFC